MENNNLHLSEFVKETMKEKGLTYRIVSDATNGEVSYGTVYAIANGKQQDIGILTLKGLAKGLGVTNWEMYQAACGEKPVPKLRESLSRLYVLLEEATDEDINDLLPVFRLVENDLIRKHIIRLQSLTTQHVAVTFSQKADDIVYELAKTMAGLTLEEEKQIPKSLKEKLAAVLNKQAEIADQLENAQNRILNATGSKLSKKGKGRQSRSRLRD